MAAAPVAKRPGVVLALSDWIRDYQQLCIRDRKEAGLIFPRFPTEFRYMTLDIADHSRFEEATGVKNLWRYEAKKPSEGAKAQDQNIISIFPDCRDFIEEALGCGGVVLAHCNGGIATAPAIITGYLMWKYNWNFDTALSYIQSKRYCVSPTSFTVQLKEYEPIYIAEKMLAASGTSNISRDKRQVDDDDDDEGYTRKMPNSSNPGNSAGVLTPTAPGMGIMDMS